MKPITGKRNSAFAGAPNANQMAFTLIELLVVIAIIAILASLSLVVIAKVREDGRKKEAQREIHALLVAIAAYRSDTGAYPVSSGAMDLAASTHGDFTYGGASLDAVFGATGNWSTNNSEVIAILMDREKYPNGTPTVNFGHVKNAQKKAYLTDVDMVEATTLPGLGPDLVFRDPWGNPYIISFDLNYDEKCADALYEKSAVSRDSGSSGYNGLVNSADPSGASDAFQYHGGVMIWSLGPDKKGDQNAANVAPNRDNILSWK
jgi:prepilin-type N-terminal cleavage/methylation domain-containing protein